MASFAENRLPQYSPYVSSIPVEAMAKVGAWKQQRYEENVKAIQENLDKIGGLDIIRDSGRQYAQSKMNKLQSKIGVLAAGDFSNMQLTNSVNSMIKGVAQDSTIVNEVASTQRYRKELEYIDKERQEGNLVADNYWDFQQNASKWLEGDLNQSFNAKYQKYYDVEKHARDFFAQVKPDGVTFDEAFRKDANGRLVPNYALIRKSKEGLFPKKVQETIDAIFSDPRVSNQLAIEGRYRYKDYTPEDLEQALTVSKEAEYKSIDAQKEKLKLNQQGLSQDELQEAFDYLDEQKQRLDAHYNETIPSLLENPDQAKALLRKAEVRNQYASVFTWQKTKETLHENPIWNNMFKERKFAWEKAKWRQERLDKLKETEQNPLLPVAQWQSQAMPEKSVKKQILRANEALNTAKQQVNASENDILFETLIKGKDSSEFFNMYSQIKQTSGSEELAKEKVLEQYYNSKIQEKGDADDFEQWKTYVVNSLSKNSAITNNPKLKEKWSRYKTDKRAALPMEQAMEDFQEDVLNVIGDIDISKYIDKSFIKKTEDGKIKVTIKETNFLGMILSMPLFMPRSNEYELEEEDIRALAVAGMVHEWNKTDENDMLYDEIAEVGRGYLVRKYGKEKADMLISNTDFYGLQQLSPLSSLVEDILIGGLIKGEGEGQLGSLVEDIKDKIENENYMEMAKTKLEQSINDFHFERGESIPMLSMLDYTSKNYERNKENLSASISNLINVYNSTDDLDAVVSDVDSFNKFVSSFDGENSLPNISIQKIPDRFDAYKTEYKFALPGSDGEMGYMPVQEQQFQDMGLTPITVNKPKEIRILEQTLKSKNNIGNNTAIYKNEDGFSSNYDISDLETMREIEGWWDNVDFPRMIDSDINVKVHIEKLEGEQYMPYIYANRQNTDTDEEGNPTTYSETWFDNKLQISGGRTYKDLNQLKAHLDEMLSPAFIERAFLFNKSKQ